MCVYSMQLSKISFECNILQWWISPTLWTHIAIFKRRLECSRITKINCKKIKFLSLFIYFMMRCYCCTDDNYDDDAALMLLCYRCSMNVSKRELFWWVYKTELLLKRRYWYVKWFALRNTILDLKCFIDDLVCIVV